MKYYLKIVAVACLALLTAQCEVIDSDLLNNPNAPSPANVDPDFLLNNIQLSALGTIGGAASTGAEMTRMRYMFGSTYGEAYSSQSFNGVYQGTYAGLFIDVENLLPIAEERSLFFHAGMAKTLKAYAMLTMVDVFGDVPFSEALDPSNLNPNVDPGEQVYNNALTLLDEAITDLQNDNRLAFPDNDLYFGEADDQVEAWVRAANTLKLKAYLNMGDATNFNNLAANVEDDLISEMDHDWTFQYGTTTVNPDSRNPLFTNNYVDQANNYMAVNYLNMMLNDKSVEDPRMSYYFYRQTTSDPFDVNLNTCINAPAPGHFQGGDPWCLLGDGWWGRDHLIDDGIPPDGDLRTTFGVYPAGGRFDAGQGDPTEPEHGYQGAGFAPMFMSSWTWFIIAEGELTFNGDEGAARTALEEAIRLSLTTVQEFGADAVPLVENQDGDMVPHPNSISDSEIDDYVDLVLVDRWDANTRDKLRIVSKEFYLALWPNGLEAYNMMRRTGYPNRVDNLQPARNPSPGDWWATFGYPAVLIERNSNVSAKSSRLATTFWDDGNYDFNF